MLRSALLILVGMTAIVVLEIIALEHGIDGKCLTIAVGILAGLAGYQGPRFVRGFRSAPERPDDKREKSV